MLTSIDLFLDVFGATLIGYTNTELKELAVPYVQVFRYLQNWVDFGVLLETVFLRKVLQLMGEDVVLKGRVI